jgi:probable HAF family extracellular repeat protein
MRRNGVASAPLIAFSVLICMLMLQVAGRALARAGEGEQAQQEREPAAQTDYPYTVIDLGTLGGTYTIATGVNSLGQVVGISQNGAGIERAFIWLPSPAYGRPAGISDLGTPGNERSAAEAITATGLVTGYRYIGEFYRAYVHDLETGTTLDLDTLGGSYNEATDIASGLVTDIASGVVVGSSYLDGDTTNHAFFAADFNADGVIDNIDLGTLGGTHSRALATNDALEVAGWADTEDDLNFHAFRWKDLNGNDLSDPGEMINLGTLGGTYSGATGISPDGKVVGWANPAGSGASVAFLWEDKNGNGASDPGEMVALGTLGGASSSALAISPDGTKVVGTSNPTGSTLPRAFLWSFEGGMVNLNTLIDPAAGWTLEEASAIYGDLIVGTGWHNGQIGAYLLTPVSTGPELDEFTLKPATITGCKSLKGIAELDAPAPPGGAEVTMTYTNSTAHGPAKVTIPHGVTRKSFTITTDPVSEVTWGTITATYDGVSQSATLTVRPISVQSLTLNPTTVVGPAPSTGTVNLECPVPEDIGSITVDLSSDKPSIASPTVTSLTFNKDESSKSFSIQTTEVSETKTVLFKAKANKGSKKAALKVKPRR